MSDLTRPQQLVIKKLGSWFKLSRKTLLASVDLGALTDNILYFPDLGTHEDYLFQERIYCIEGEFHLGHSLDPATFAKTDLWQSWMNFRSGTVYAKDTETLMAYCIKGAVLIVRQGKDELSLGVGESGIVLQHEYLNKNPLFLTPFKEFMRAWYPRPSL